jgi:Flp pilus assembly protein TadG
LAHDIRDISSTGLFLLTEQRWYPGTLVMLSLQRVGVANTDPDRSIMVNAKVIRLGTDGVGLELIMPEKPAPPGVHNLRANGTDRKTFHRFLQRLLGDRGQALIEYILMLPLLFLLIVNVVNFGGFFAAWITVANAARAGADYAILSGNSVGSPGDPTAAQITNMITQDISSLPNASSLSVNICQNNNGVITTLAGTCSSVPSDPEPVSYILTTIDVTYTYLPFINVFQFPNLNIYATIPPTTVHRRAVMRAII